MKFINSDSLYIRDNSSVIQTTKKSFIGITSLFMVMLFIGAGFFSFSEQVKNPPTASAGIISCQSDLGTGFGQDGFDGWGATGFAVQDAQRHLTGKEMFQGSMHYVSYNGELKADAGGWFVGSNNTSARVKGAQASGFLKGPDPFSADLKPRYEGARDAIGCMFGSMSVGIANTIISFNNMGTGIITFITTAGFNPPICDHTINKALGDGDVETAELLGGCVDLIKIVGGDSDAVGSNEGIIGSLTHTLYFPLIALVALAVAATVAWSGIVKREIRKAFGQVLWCILAVFIGAFFLLQPKLLATAPAVATKTTGTCVILAFSGGNCMSNSSGSSIGTNATGSNTDGPPLCKVEMSDGSGPSDAGNLLVESLNCSIWKAFVLESYSQSSFGTNYDSLNCSKIKSIKGFESAASDYRVNSLTKGTLQSSLDDGILKTSGAPRCNLALYQLSLITSMQNGSEKNYGNVSNPMPDHEDQSYRWYKIIGPVMQNESMVNSWVHGDFTKLLLTLVSTVTIILGGIVLVVTAIFALIFYFSAIMLMAFAPLFMLLGIHPGRGKEIFKGWLETVLSNILKYMASALFLIVSLAMYGAVLGSIGNAILALLFVVILTIALLTYRREIVDLIGKVDMGGAKLTSKMSDNKMWKSSKKAAVAGGFGALGAASKGHGVKDRLSRATGGFKDGSADALSRDSQAFRQFRQGQNAVEQDQRGKLKEDIAARRDAISGRPGNGPTGRVGADGLPEKNLEDQVSEDAYDLKQKKGDYNETVKTMNEIKVEIDTGKDQSNDIRGNILNDVTAGRGAAGATFSAVITKDMAVVQAQENAVIAKARFGEDSDQYRGTVTRVEEKVQARDLERAKISDQDFNEINNEYKEQLRTNNTLADIQESSHEKEAKWSGLKEKADTQLVSVEEARTKLVASQTQLAAAEKSVERLEKLSEKANSIGGGLSTGKRIKETRKADALMPNQEDDGPELHGQVDEDKKRRKAKEVIADVSAGRTVRNLEKDIDKRTNGETDTAEDHSVSNIDPRSGGGLPLPPPISHRAPTSSDDDVDF